MTEILRTANATNIDLCNFYRGGAAFLLCSGPSLTAVDSTLLQKRGVISCSVNNAASVFRSSLWVSLDDPGNFCDVIWRDPAITKFVPIERLDRPIRIRNKLGELVESNEKVRDMPATIGFQTNNVFSTNSWLHEDTVNCGNDDDKIDEIGNRGSRSVMLAALRLLYYLGFRKVFLLGCDFRMSYGKCNYAFDQAQTRLSVRGNNRTYRVLAERLKLLKPYFENESFEVFNCTPNSDLTVFPFIQYEKAISVVTDKMPNGIDTAGMYDRRHM